MKLRRDKDGSQTGTGSIAPETWATISMDWYGIFDITWYLFGVFEENVFPLALGTSQDYSVFAFAF
jgi:hypothetical protein